MLVILEWRHRQLHMRASLERNSGQSRFHWITRDLLSIPEYAIKKGRPHGHRYGKTPEKKEYHLVHDLKNRCIKRGFTGIHGRFLRDHVFRKRMLEHDRNEDVCREWDDLAEQDFTYRMCSEPDKIFSISQTELENGINQASTVYKSGDNSAPCHTGSTATVIEFFFHLVAVEWILVVFLRI